MVKVSASGWDGRGGGGDEGVGRWERMQVALQHMVVLATAEQQCTHMCTSVLVCTQTHHLLRLVRLITHQRSQQLQDLLSLSEQGGEWLEGKGSMLSTYNTITAPAFLAPQTEALLTTSTIHQSTPPLHTHLLNRRHHYTIVQQCLSDVERNGLASLETKQCDSRWEGFQLEQGQCLLVRFSDVP